MKDYETAQINTTTEYDKTPKIIEYKRGVSRPKKKCP